jgi:hypothetical protein
MVGILLEYMLPRENFIALHLCLGLPLRGRRRECEWSRGVTESELLTQDEY